MNENRSLFALDGITGMLIATVLLLTILAGLTVWNMSEIGRASCRERVFRDV